jgi:hypothetical protein
VVDPELGADQADVLHQAVNVRRRPDLAKSRARTVKPEVFPVGACSQATKSEGTSPATLTPWQRRAFATKINHHP